MAMPPSTPAEESISVNNALKTTIAVENRDSLRSFYGLDFELLLRDPNYNNKDLQVFFGAFRLASTV